MSDTLTQICDVKRGHIARNKQMRSPSDLRTLAEHMPPTRGFLSSMQKATALPNKPDEIAANRTALIAEIKKASPSAGLIRSDFDPVAIANSYQSAGATCLSVLTDEDFFQGHDTYLHQIRDHVALPILRKDFIIDPYQVYETKALEADCMLLIMACLDDALARDLHQLALSLGLDVIVEVHNQEELDRALLLTPHMIGVNNRNLKTLEVSLQTSHELKRNMPDHIFPIAESGIKTHKDLEDLQNIGFKGFLVGEHLMKQDDIEAATKKLLNGN